MFSPPPNVSQNHKDIIAAYNSGWIAAMNGSKPHAPFSEPKLRQAWTDGYRNSRAETKS